MRPAAETDPLLAAAKRARLDGWADWELPEVVMAVARNRKIPCPPYVARAITAQARTSTV